jgi:hypothetical protein
MSIIVERKIDSITTYAVVLASEWYGGIMQLAMGYRFVHPDDFVVCKWSDFHDGERSNIEGKVTIAICRELEDAMTILDSRTLK